MVKSTHFYKMLLLCIAEKGNIELWYLKIFREKNLLSHIKVNIINDHKNAEIIPKLISNNKAIDKYDHPHIIGINEKVLYEAIDKLFEDSQNIGRGQITVSKLWTF